MAWAGRRRRRAIVGGRSMIPTLQPGWFVLVDPAARAAPGDIVTIRHPDQDDVVMIKRFVATRGGGIWVESDNPESGTDSRTFGALPADHLVGRVTLILDRVRQPLRSPAVS